MTPDQIAAVRPRLVEFAARMLGDLSRSDQRASGELYLRGLLLDGQRKSMQPMAARLGVDHQQLQQFISASTWDYARVRRNLACWGAEGVAPEAYVLDDTGFAKDGTASPCVARQYSGTLGKIGNCQIGVSVHQVSEHASVAANWRLFCPASWDDATAGDDPGECERIRVRRARAHLPDEVRHREKWRLGLDMIDEMTGSWGLPELPVVADGGYGEITAFRAGLEQRGLTYVTAVKGTTTAYAADAAPETPPYSGRGRPPTPAYRHKPPNLRKLAFAHADQVQPVAWRAGTRPTRGNPTATMRSQFLAIRVRPANRDIPRGDDGSLPERWLLAEWPPHADEPTDYWLSNLPDDTPITELVRLAKIRWRIEHDYRELKTGLGLDHFEGRSYQGWNRHVTLVAIAQALCTLLRLDPKAHAPA